MCMREREGGVGGEKEVNRLNLCFDIAFVHTNHL